MKLKFIVAVGLAVCSLTAAQSALGTTLSSDVLGAYLHKTLADDLEQLNLLDRTFNAPKGSVQKRRAKRGRKLGLAAPVTRKLAQNQYYGAQLTMPEDADQDEMGLGMDGGVGGGMGGFGLMGGMGMGAGMGASGIPIQQRSVKAAYDRMKIISKTVEDTKERLLKQLGTILAFTTRYKQKQWLQARNAAREKAAAATPAKPPGKRMLFNVQPDISGAGHIEDHEGDFLSLRAPTGLELSIDDVAGLNLKAALDDSERLAA